MEDNGLTVTINGKSETLHGVEKLVYLKGGERAVVNRREYIAQSNDMERNFHREMKRLRFSAVNEKSRATHCCYDKRDDDYIE